MLTQLPYPSKNFLWLVHCLHWYLVSTQETQGKPPYDAEILLFTLRCCRHGRVTDTLGKGARRVEGGDGNTPLLGPRAKGVLSLWFLGLGEGGKEIHL